jgi:F-type H+-transporting ATPase subunit b
MDSQSAGVLSILGIEGKLFIAQLVNFGIVIFVLWKLAYKPLLKMMDERTKKIEQGLKDAEASAGSRKLAEDDRTTIVAEARRAAKDIMDQAAILAARERQEATVRTKAEVEKIVSHGKETIRAEKDKMMLEAKAEVGSLVALATERVLRAKLNATADAKLIENAISDVERAADGAPGRTA